MTYREYLWMNTKETLENVVPCLVVIGFFALTIGAAALVIFVLIMIIEFLTPIFGLFTAFGIGIGTLIIGGVVSILIIDYRYYKNCVKKPTEGR